MFVHGDNISQKKVHTTKYLDDESRKYIMEIDEEYQKWKKENLALVGTDKDTVYKRVDLLNCYKNFIDQQKYAEKFDSRSRLHSSVIEEFIYYLFKDVFKSQEGKVFMGTAEVFKDIYFHPPNYSSMLAEPNVKIELKEHDFIIGVDIIGKFRCEGASKIEAHHFRIPAVAIECKTYLDKTMLEGSANSAEQLKIRQPNALYVIVAEYLKLTEAVNLHKYKIDQIYVLRRQINIDREFRFLPEFKKKPVYPDLVWDLFQFVSNHLYAKSWEIGAALEKGKLI